MAYVLLAADVEPTSSRVVARLALEAAGHIVQEVHDGYDALEIAEATRPDALVLDTLLSGLDGIQVLDRFRRRRALRHLPVVLLSNIPRNVAGELARSLGAVRFLARPFTNADLADALEAALATRPPAAAPADVTSTAAHWGPRAPASLRVAEAATSLDLPLTAPSRAEEPRRRPAGA